MNEEMKKKWYEEYLEFCKTSGGEFSFTPRLIPVSNDGAVFKIDVALDVIEYKEK